DIRKRAAFPMFVVKGANVRLTARPQERADHYGNHDPPSRDDWQRALHNTVFFQLADTNNWDFVEIDEQGHAQVPLPQLRHAIVRSDAAHLVDRPLPPDSQTDNPGRTRQLDVIDRGNQIVMTDYPSNFLVDSRYAGGQQASI